MLIGSGIIGLGIDLVNIDRIERSISRFQGRFIERIFRDGEIKRAESRPLTRMATYAKRFAAKEACSKALGTGFSRGVYFRDIEVINHPSGRPTLKLHNGAARRLEEITPKGRKADIHLSITDEVPMAQAIVIIAAL